MANVHSYNEIKNRKVGFIPMILSNLNIHSENDAIALQHEDPLRYLNEKATETIYKIIENTKTIIFNRHLNPEADIYHLKCQIEADLNNLQVEYRKQLSAAYRKNRESMRSIYNNPIIDSFKNIMSKDLSQFSEDLLNEEFTLYKEYTVNSNFYNYITQMNAAEIYRQIDELNKDNVLNDYIHNNLNSKAVITTCTLRNASLYYSRLMMYFDQMNAIFNTFEAMVEMAKLDISKVLISDRYEDAHKFDPIALLNVLKNRLFPILHLITHLASLLRAEMENYLNIVEDVTIKAEGKIAAELSAKEETVDNKEYKAPIW